MKKKTLALLLILAFVIGLTACENNQSELEVATEGETALVEDVPASKTTFSNDYEEGTSQFLFKGYSYNVPKTWEERQNDDTTFFYYPQTGNSINFLMVSFTELNGSVMDNSTFDSIVSGMKNSESTENSVVLTQTYKTNLNGIKYGYVEYTGDISGATYTIKIALFDCEFGCVCFGLTLAPYHLIDYSNDYNKVLDSIATSEPIGTQESSESTEEVDQSGEEKQENQLVAQPTIGQFNAVQKAKSYLRISGFSEQGLIEQLKYEGFTEEEATYGAKNCGANWNEQAEKSARAYLKVMSFSRQGLIDQLKYEGYTQEQAEYGASAVGY